MSIAPPTSILGDTCRTNFGLYTKYDIGLDSMYKTYIDTLEQTMILAAYGSNINNCIITQSLNLNISQEDIDSCIGEIRYYILEQAIIRFCQLHDVCLTIQRNNTYLTIIINMLQPFRISYN